MKSKNITLIAVLFLGLSTYSNSIYADDCTLRNSDNTSGEIGTVYAETSLTTVTFKANAVTCEYGMLYDNSVTIDRHARILRT